MEKTIYNRYTENMTFNYQTSLNQSNTFTRFHTCYNVRLTNLVNNQSVCFEYQCNPRYNKPSKTNCLWAYLMDAQAYYYSDDDIDNFALEYGYTKPSEAFKVFNARKKAYNDLVNFFGSEKTLHAYIEAFQEY